MSKRISVVFCLMILCLLELALPTFAVDQYWISYSRVGSGTKPTNNPSGPKFLLKIDVLGNTIVPATLVVPNSRSFVGALEGGSAIAHGNPGQINMWIVQKTPAVTAPIYRAIINNRTLKLIDLRKTALRCLFTSYIQVTQRQYDNFLAIGTLEATNRKYIGFTIASSGALVGQKFLLSQDPADPNDNGFGVSSDGRIFFYTVAHLQPSGVKLLIQHLNPQGMRQGKPISVINSRGLSAMDVSNVLPGSKRYVLFGGIRAGSLWLQPIDARSGAKIGPSVRIAAVAGTFQDAALDPEGRFVIYRGIDSCLFYQALDSLGRRSGQPRTLTNAVEGGIDILKD